MPIHNLKEYSNNYPGTTRSLWQYDEDEPKDPITDSYLFKFKARFPAYANNCNIINAEIGE